MTALIQELRIEDFAIIDRLDLSLDPGLTVFTGETGAGKSILVGAFKLLLGGRSTSDLIRTGADRAVVEALISVPPKSPTLALLTAKNIELDKHEMVIRRVINKNGRSRVTLNGQLITVGMLSDIMRPLIDICGQHEHVALLEAENHIDRVDEFGGLLAVRAEVSRIHSKVIGYESALRALDLGAAERLQREDYLRFQVDEIEGLAPQPGEVGALESEHRRLSSAGRLMDGARQSESELYSMDGSVVEVLGRIEQRLTDLARFDEQLGVMSASVGSALAELEDLSRGLERYAEGVSCDPARLYEIDDRLDLLRKLMRKHGGSIEAVLDKQSALVKELGGLTKDETRRADLESSLKAERAILFDLSAKLSVGRKKAALKLARAVETNIQALAMPEARVQIELLALESIGARGGERAEIRIAANPGEPFRPLHKTASGGELSRLLLAFKQVLAEGDCVGAYIFDEVDAGIGGAVADVVGQKLKEVSNKRQVFTVTHLPQVAAYADAHFRVCKKVAQGRTVSRVLALSGKAAREELARMLGGSRITAQTRKLAQEMRSAATGDEALAVIRAGRAGRNRSVGKSSILAGTQKGKGLGDRTEAFASAGV
jgi:DNA repair protein RecN (Recombination protein N)